ncbi:hypothetical protein RQP46_008089 [Phenoliferia psychrophenolica]
MTTPASASASAPPGPPAAPPASSEAALEPPSKSSLKRKEKEVSLVAKKALKAASKVVPSASKKDKDKARAAGSVRGGDTREEFPEVLEGGKKDQTIPMATSYSPKEVERTWYNWWRSSSFFLPAIASSTPSPFSFFDEDPQFIHRSDKDFDWSQIDPNRTFVIPAPPPNITGSLHIGHALAFSLQDILVRWIHNAFYIPGFDHAGLSTQSVVEKRLLKSEHLTRHDLGRDQFLQRCEEWKEEYETRITNQICRLGVSCDWTRVAFTMSREMTEAVEANFVRLFEDGVVYRANRIVNWCVAMNTTLSNLEVDQLPIPRRTLLPVPGYDATEKFEFGVMHTFAYSIEGPHENDRIIVATTRPETMLGDTAIAVHPDDERYKHLHDKFALHPFLPRRRLPIILDAFVDMTSGTGAVKITPAHDPDDFEVGLRHELEFVNILNDDGTLNANAGPQFQGMKRFHARTAVLEALKAQGLYVDSKDHAMTLPICSKSGDVIEPLMKPQWWVNCKSMAEEAIKRTKAGELKIRPKSSEDEWYRWLATINDWCISRQLWYSHRCPAYFVDVEGVEQDRMNGNWWVAAESLEIATTKAEVKFRDAYPTAKFTIEQDKDVLDTWFSSALWPFSILGWPKDTPDLHAFYPTSLLETGHDILFFWVARMVLLGLKLTNKVPFKEVFCHAMIRDAHGRKMSKSLGNVIDPIDVIEGSTLEALGGKLRVGNLAEGEIERAEEGQKKDFPNGIPECGTDALRFALANYSAAGRDINLEILRVEGYRKFCNKLWNATKFAMHKLDPKTSFAPDAGPLLDVDGSRLYPLFVPAASQTPTGAESLVERWILHKLNEATKGVNTALELRNFMDATNAVYKFWLYEVCDVYIESIKLVTDPRKPGETHTPEQAAKRTSALSTLYAVVESGLRLLHPFMPFVTEELWQRLPRRPGDRTKSIMLARYPEPDVSREFEKDVRDFDVTFLGVKAIRGIATSYGLNSNLQVFFHAHQSLEFAETLRSSSANISVLIKGCSSFTVVDSKAIIPDGCVSDNVSPELTVSLLLKGFVDVDGEVAKLEKKRTFAETGLVQLRERMSASDYETTRPREMREKDAQALEMSVSSLSASVVSLLGLK